MESIPQPRAERRRLFHGGPRRAPEEWSTSPPADDRNAEPWRKRRRGSPETMSLVIDGGGAKGDVLAVAELAGVMGAKRTSD